MKKIPTLLVRDPDDRAHVLDEVTPGCEWVLAGEGRPTRKYDGTCTMLDPAGKWWARREVKAGLTAPANYVEDNFDPITGKHQGWVPIEDSPFAKFHAEALRLLSWPPDELAGTYELCGPKINGNPENFVHHELMSHARAELGQVYTYLTGPDFAKATVIAGGRHGWEGIVWHHSDGRMAKLKARDLKAEVGL